MNRIPLEEVQGVLERVLRGFGMTEARARLCARLFAETTCDGVYTHGVSRFPRFVATIRNGCVDVSAEPLRVAGLGAVERWDGQKGPGNLNAYACMERAMSLSRAHGVACVSLGNTNHWMRGGTYGWQAAEAGMIGICWTNTMPNVPPWGGTTPTLGNNPLVLAVPRRSGAVVLDIAMSQFSYGALEACRLRGEQLPVAGGFDAAGELTTAPGVIEAIRRPVPIGFWKGAGLSLMLDVIGAIVSGGKLTAEIPADSFRETGVSQMFVAIGPGERFGRAAEEAADEAIRFLKSSEGVSGARIRYPGEETLRIRAENMARGIPVEEALWEQISREESW